MIQRLVTWAMALLLTGCFLRTEPLAPPTPADAPALEARVLGNSTDLGAVSDLALVYLSEGRYGDARALLVGDDAQRAADPAVPLLLAAAEEQLGQFRSARARYEDYLSTRLGQLVPHVRSRLFAIRPSAAREDAQVLLSGPLPEQPVISETVAVFPFARSSADPIAEAQAVGVSALVGWGLSADGRRVVDDQLLRVLLDELGVPPQGLADLSLGVEIGRRLGAGWVVQGTVRQESVDAAEWEVTVLSMEAPDSLRVDQLTISGRPSEAPSMAGRLGAFVDEALRRFSREAVGGELGTSQEAITELGSGLLDWDRRDAESAYAHFERATELDPQLTTAADLAEQMDAWRNLQPLVSAASEVVRVGEVQRSVLALQRWAGSSEQEAWATVGLSERAIVSDVLGFDEPGGSTLVDVTLTLPGAGP